jgi:hypothetical protein
MRRLLLTFAASALMGSVALAAPVQGPAQAPTQKGAAPVQAPTQKVSPAQKPTQAPTQKGVAPTQAPVQKGGYKMASAPRGLRYR